jgi:signal transduction histidine kinase
MFHEKNITRLIIIIPILFLITIVISTIFLSINLINTHYKEDIKTAQNNELKLQKQFIKTQIESVYNYIEQKKTESPKRLKELLKERVYTGLNIAQKIYDKNFKTLSEQTLQTKILETLRKVRFGENGYYFIAEVTNDNKIISRMLPSTPDKENIYAHQLKDVDGFHYVQAFANIVTNEPTNEGFVEYKWFKLSDKKPYAKISFVKLFEPYNWFIGFGEYYDEFDKKIKEEALRRLDLFKFGKNGYVWTLNTNHILIQHPYRPEAIGNDESNVIDSHGNNIAALSIKNALKNKAGSFIEYYWNKPNETIPSKKISYVKHIPDWDWVVGTGVYLEDVQFTIETIKKKQEEEIRYSTVHLLLVSTIILIFAIISSFIVSRKINETLLKYRQKLIYKQEELQQLNESLEQKVDDKTKELQLLNNNLEKTIKERLDEIKQKDKKLLEQSKMVALGEMIGNISHQWRQPLSAISTSASGLQLKQDMGTLEENDIKEFSSAIVNNANYLSQVIEDFKNYIKGDKHKEDFFIHEPIEKALNIVNSSLQNHNLQVIKYFDTSILIHNVQNELVQALVNILNNSKDAYVLNQFDEDKRYIFIHTQYKTNSACIIIKDNAQGINEEILPKIFEPYFTTKEKSQGTGLGLYMTYQIITQSLQGSIVVENIEYHYNEELCKGVQFTIELPF